MSQYKPYPAYKDSGVEWLGKVPEHWNIERVRQRYHLSNGYPFNSSLFQPEGEAENRLIRIRDLTPTDAFIYTEEACTDNALIGNGDVLIGMDGDFNAVLWNEGRAKLNQRVCALRGATVAQTKYFLYSIPMVLGIINNTAYATTVKHLSSGEVMSAKLAFPPQKELGKIVEILDRETARIDSLVAAKTRFIELLKEKRQALITRAVTKGLDPKVKLKDSGIEWLGQVPEHWQYGRFIYTCQLLVDGTHQSPESYTEGEYLYITAKNIKENGFDFSDIAYVKEEDQRQIFPRCPGQKGDVLYIKDGATAGVAMVNDLEQEFSMLSSVALIRPNVDFLESRFIRYHLNAGGFKQYVLSQLVGGAITRFTLDVISRFIIVRPPLNEQITIVTYLDQITARIDALITKTQRSIELLKERRSALITAAVTGKIDLREASV